jgi:hypothetical protein
MRPPTRRRTSSCSASRCAASERSSYCAQGLGFGARPRQHAGNKPCGGCPSQVCSSCRSVTSTVAVCVKILRHGVQMGDGAPAASADRAAVIAAVVAAAKADMAADRKTTALKSLQVEDWPSGLTVSCLISGSETCKPAETEVPPSHFGLQRQPCIRS